MIFKFLTVIVFISEIIITVAILVHLNKLSKSICKYNRFIEELKPELVEMSALCRKISESLLEYAPVIVRTFKSLITNIIIGQLKNFVAGITFWAVKKEIEKRIQD